MYTAAGHCSPPPTMAGRLFLLRPAHRHPITTSSSMLLQVSPLRSLLTSPDSDGPCAAAPLFLRRAHSAAGLAIASSSSSSTSDEGAATVPPENNGKAKASGASGKRSLGKAKKVGGGVGGKGTSSSGKGLDVVLQSLDVMTKKLLGLEKEVKVLKENVILRTPLRTEKRDGIALGRQGSCLSSMFSVKDGVGRKRLIERKRPALGDGGGVEVKLSAEAVAILERFREDGYLKGVDLWQDGKLVPERLQDLRIRNSLKSASDKFGVEHQEIAKWLSGSDMKKVALFGCPSVEKKTVFAAKQLRAFFSVQEDVVCRACKWKSSCKFVNRQFAKDNKLMLSDAMRVLMSYSFFHAPQETLLPSEMEESISKLLKEIVNLSK